MCPPALTTIGGWQIRHPGNGDYGESGSQRSNGATEHERRRRRLKDMRPAGRPCRPAVIITYRQKRKPQFVSRGLCFCRSVMITARKAGRSHALRSSSVAPLLRVNRFLRNLRYREADTAIHTAARRLDRL